MSTSSILIPPEDAWLVARLSRIIAKRLAEGSDSPNTRRSLLRALFALQRLPVLFPDLSISICAGRHQVDFNCERFEFVSYTEDWHTEFRIQYFARSFHCIEGFSMLEGDRKREAAELRLDDFEEAMAVPDELSIEDYSKEGQVDEPPIDAYLDYAQTYDKR